MQDVNFPSEDQYAEFQEDDNVFERDHTLAKAYIDILQKFHANIAIDDDKVRSAVSYLLNFPPKFFDVTQLLYVLDGFEYLIINDLLSYREVTLKLALNLSFRFAELKEAKDYKGDKGKLSLVKAYKHCATNAFRLAKIYELYSFDNELSYDNFYQWQLAMVISLKNFTKCAEILVSKIEDFSNTQYKSRLLSIYEQFELASSFIDLLSYNFIGSTEVKTMFRFLCSYAEIHNNVKAIVTPAQFRGLSNLNIRNLDFLFKELEEKLWRSLKFNGLVNGEARDEHILIQSLRNEAMKTIQFTST